MFRRRPPAGGSAGVVAATGWGARPSSSMVRPGIGAPAGLMGCPRNAYKIGRGAIGVGVAFPGEGDQSYPAELNNRTVRNVLRTPPGQVTDRIPRGQDWDAAMPALNLGLPWRPAPDSPARRPYGPGTGGQAKR